MNAQLDDRQLGARWAKVGALFGVAEAASSPDVERLLLDSASKLSANSRLFKMAASWLARYGHLIARHRLAKRIESESLAPDSSAALGLLLDVAGELNPEMDSHFNLPRSKCAPAQGPERPLFEQMRRHPIFVSRVLENAWPVSRKWRLLVEPFEIKSEALRPLAAILDRNPSFWFRNCFRGKLPASLIAELMSNASAGRNEKLCAEALGVTRAALRHVIAQLNGSFIESKRQGRENCIRLRPVSISRSGLPQAAIAAQPKPMPDESVETATD